MDTEYDRVRMVRDKHYRYLYNYMPEKPYYQNIAYRLSIPMMKEILNMRDEGRLDAIQMHWFDTKPVEELYDAENDPYELHSLVNDPKHKAKLTELRSAFQNWTKQVGDMGSIPEQEMIRQMWKDKDVPPVTDTPNVIKTATGVKLFCATRGASIGYRIVKAGESQQPEMHTIQSWDFEFAFGARNGGKKPAAPVWQVYDGAIIPLNKEDTLLVNAMRIGYKAVTLAYKNGQVVNVEVENKPLQ